MERNIIISGDLITVFVFKNIITNFLKDSLIDYFQSYNELIEVEINNDDTGFILVDNQINYSSGYEIIEYLRFKMKFRGQIIYICDTTQESKRALMIGASKTILKPIVVEDLKNIFSRKF
ncbi:MAG: response regulator [Paludibacteraceae bacterium]